MEIAIRAMVKEDWESVAEIFQEGIELRTATFSKHVPSYEEWDALHKKDCRLVAVDGGTVIGWAALSPYSHRPAYYGVAEASIYIRSGYRGKQVGSRLFQALIDESEKQGYWTLISKIIEINEASILLHEKLGFRRIGYHERIAQDQSGVWQNTVLMERRSRKTGI